MSYEWVTPEERRQLTDVCEEVIHYVQNEVRDHFTFDIRLIGSGEKKLLTQNSENGNFDLDYNLILQKDKQNLIGNPDKIKNIFISAFNKYNPSYNFKNSQDRTSVITSKLVYDKRLYFSFDVALLIEGNDGSYYKLIHDKELNRYIWNQIPQSVNYMSKFNFIKKNDLFTDFKKRYLDKKNYYLSIDPQKKSFSIFLETINEIYRS